MHGIQIQNEIMAEMLDPTGREQFLQARMSGLGGTDASAVCHKNPWRDTVRVWAEKSDLWPDEDVRSEPMKWGILQEHLVAMEYCQKTGHKVRRPAKVMDKQLGFKSGLRRHTQFPWMIAHLDRLILNTNIGLECKTTNVFAFKSGDWGEEGTDQVPEHYLLQCQHYMAVGGYDSFDLAVLIGGNDHRVYHIPRNERLIADLIEIESSFWKDYVEAGVCPMADGSESSFTSLKKLQPTAKMQKGLIAKTANEEINQAIGRMADLNYDGKQIKTEYDKLKALVMQFMGGASELMIEDVVVATYRNNRDGVKFDAKALKVKHPELYEKFCFPTKGARPFKLDFKRYVKREDRAHV